jgi:MoaA/NifB/PqqE/SkfB family radical SAM enzyme
MEPLKVCPIQGRQLKDVREEDIFYDFRICNTYRGGGGYDQFPVIARRRGLIDAHTHGDIKLQFVVQLFGCHLRCNYCYVTRDGIYGMYVKYPVSLILQVFYQAAIEKGVGVFHMMGGAPALWMQDWVDIPAELCPNYLFHSDLLLTEGPYDINILKRIATNNALYAINIKGVNSTDHMKNTGKNINWTTFWRNFDKVIESGLNYYITFTNPDPNGLDEFKNTITKKYGKEVLEDSFTINLKIYDAIKDREAW